MSNVVQFLETLARNPKHLSHDEFIAAVMHANLPNAIQEALLKRDVTDLSQALDARGLMFCVVFPADNEPAEGEEPQEDGGETPAEEPTSKAA